DLNAEKIGTNYAHDHRGRIKTDKHGNRIVKSYDYGLMQINSLRIHHDAVKDFAGHAMKVTDKVKSDWRANAQVGVATLRHNYDLIRLSESPGASQEDVALATYAAYNHGEKRWHHFLQMDSHGVPKDGSVRNFYNRYKVAPEK